MHKLVALSALLIPALAVAQPTTTTTTTNDTTTTTTTTVTPAPPPPPPPAPSTTVTVEGTLPGQPPTPVVIINPSTPPVTRSVILPEYETVYDAYNAPVFTTGAVVFLTSYGGSVIAAATASDVEKDRGTEKLYIPVAGPWLALNERGDCPSSTNCDHEDAYKVLLVVDGIFQAAGVVTMASGILQPSSHRIVTTTVKTDTKIRVKPTVVGAHSSPGVGVYGRF